MDHFKLFPLQTNVTTVFEALVNVFRQLNITVKGRFCVHLAEVNDHQNLIKTGFKHNWENYSFPSSNLCHIFFNEFSAAKCLCVQIKFSKSCGDKATQCLIPLSFCIGKNTFLSITPDI